MNGLRATLSTGESGGFAPRRAGPVGAASPANIHPTS
jgi:hypothetical protein